MKETFLGIPADAITLPEAVEWARGWLADGRSGGFIASVNPEICVAAQADHKLRSCLLAAALGIPDGIGIVLVSRLRGGRLRGRVAGIELLLALCALAAAEGKSVFFFGAAAGVAEAAAEAATKRYPGLRLAGTQHGFIGPQEEAEAAAKIAASGADLVFVGLGSPRQEYFVAGHGAATGAKLLMAVGGSFDVLAGKVRRAPRLFRRLGLEWLYRFVRQPWRLRRLPALPRFLVQALIKKN
ncbi:MAG: N-acetylglucosaminyldiphosphoundecaprenol N-acetyl-beta-D-mannosaminyltransferase [Syntrophomonadaceae bacterium]|nr:N-acetylglucosaminyldiphosphoundecaprenol N-acetyl-beta-D-mannosaminyltransferase [Bacillota bacterium]